MYQVPSLVYDTPMVDNNEKTISTSMILDHDAVIDCLKGEITCLIYENEKLWSELDRAKERLDQHDQMLQSLMEKPKGNSICAICSRVMKFDCGFIDASNNPVWACTKCL